MPRSRLMPSLLLVSLLSIIAGPSLFAEEGLLFYVSGGLDLVPLMGDSGLRETIVEYNATYPTLSSPMGQIWGQLGLTVNGGMLFTTDSDTWFLDVRMGWVGLTATTSASNGTNTRYLNIGMDLFSGRVALLIAVEENFIYAGPGLGLVAGGLIGHTKLDSAAWAECGDAALMGWDLSFDLLVTMPGDGMPLSFFVRPYWRSMGGIIGYSYIAEGITGNSFTDWSRFESKYGGFGVQIEFMLPITM